MMLSNFLKLCNFVKKIECFCYHAGMLRVKKLVDKPLHYGYYSITFSNPSEPFAGGNERNDNIMLKIFLTFLNISLSS